MKSSQENLSPPNLRRKILMAEIALLKTGGGPGITPVSDKVSVAPAVKEGVAVRPGPQARPHPVLNDLFFFIRFFTTSLLTSTDTREAHSFLESDQY